MQIGKEGGREGGESDVGQPVNRVQGTAHVGDSVRLLMRSGARADHKYLIFFFFKLCCQL